MLLFAITKHCCRSGKISLVEEQQQDVATGVSCQLPFLRKAVKSVLNYSKSAIFSAALKIKPPICSCKGGCKIIETTSYYWSLFLSYLTQLESESLCRLSMANTLIGYTLGLCYAKNQGSKSWFLKSIFSYKLHGLQVLLHWPMLIFWKISVGAIQLSNIWKALLICH